MSSVAAAAAAAAAGRSETTAPAGSSTSTTRQGMFQCGLCSSQYKRLDHLSRHVRSHTQTKPYQCHVCAKAFGRTDLLKRHLAAHGVDGGPNRRQAVRTLRDTPVRVSQACRACATNHLRCSEPKPCRRCIERETECVWSPINPSIDSGMGGYPMMSPLDGSFAGQGGEHSDGNHLSDGQDTMDQDLEDTLSGPTSSLPTSVSQLAGFFPLRVDQSFIPGQWSTVGSPDFDFMSSLDLDDLDLRFLSQYNVNVPFAFEGYQDVLALGPPAQYADCGDVTGSTTPGHQTPLPSEAFRQAYWKFQPNSQDRGGTEEVHLSLPAGTPHGASPESRVPLDRRVTCRKLGIAARDSIVALVVKRCRPENQARAMASFPSVDLLDTLLQYYLTSSVAQADSFLHVPTFDPNEKRPELLAAMAAAGAVLTADPTLTKLGFAIQECVRTALPHLWESDNSLTRDLELSQAHLISLEIALWSGHGRKVEIAESFLQCLITMLRRGGRLRISGYPPLPPSPTWHAWIRQESFQRLAFRTLQHDSHSSMALLATPLISYAELSLPFPCAADLWCAPSPAAWTALYHGHPTPSVNLPAYFDDPSCIAGGGGIDATIARHAFLSCAWTMAWEYISLSSLQRASPRRWNTLLAASRLEELLRLLHHFRLGMEPHAQGNVDLVLRLEHISMHLHVPFEDVHVFVGMEGPEQARGAAGVMREWAGTEQARQAVWHAGQVVRVARLCEGRRVQGEKAVMLYHAALALWTYGVVVRSGGGEMGDGSWGGQPMVCLEEADSLAVQRFTQFGSGQACILGVGGMMQEERVMLTRPEQVMDVVIGVMKGNHEGMGMPPLVDRLVQLMAAVRQSSKAGGGGSG